LAAKSGIEWTESTWNPVTGCDKVSPGCKNCYAERMARRLQAMGSRNYREGFDVKLHPHVLKAPLSWKKPQMIFVNSMSDLFHDDVPLEYIQQVFAVIGETPRHHFQILTKRAERLEKLSDLLPWYDNIWMGVSIENEEYLYRKDHLVKTGATTKFLSLEPLLGPLSGLDLSGIDWVIVGGESGPRARPMKEDWVTEIRERCLSANVPFFFKQWGGFNKKKNGRLLDGRTWDGMPVAIAV
jgi:protein gp37